MFKIVEHADGYSIVVASSNVEVAWRPTYRQALTAQFHFEDVMCAVLHETNAK